MKVSIEKRLRLSIILLVLAIMVSVFIALYRLIKDPLVGERVEEIYSYENQASIDYELIEKPNILNDSPIESDRQIYISKFVEGIGLDFSYQFVGEDEVNLYGNYVIGAEILGSVYKGQEEGSVLVWKKKYPLANKRIQALEKELWIEESLFLDFGKYREFLEELAEETEINFDTSLLISMDIDLKGSTDKGDFEEQLKPNITIPLNTALFEIGGTPVIEKPGAIERTIEVQLPADRGKLAFYGIISGLAALGLVYLAFFTIAAPKKGPLERELNRIFKKHGDRLVALDGHMDISNCTPVRSMGDLVRFADEVNRPILYSYSEDYREINKFFLVNNSESYLFDLEGLMTHEKAGGTEGLPSKEEF